MKIVSLTIENFRSYRNPITITFNDLTVLIGKNDIGKSTIMEALDIFFENRKMDSDDINNDAKANNEHSKISVVFSNLPDDIDLDSGAKTNLTDEYLLNSNSLLEIKKDFSSLSKPKTFICCNHPSNEFANDLHLLKIKDLQKRVKDLKSMGNLKQILKMKLEKQFGNISPVL
ncbi:MAG: ATP-binding protein [Flavobacteriales bacterium]|nr:ATP-binding protein [Flavobacteriales bacterium]NCP84781.1 ATP-binding protein [Bacteroidota bacterium]NCQ11710.1 ATP-binding protein [Bacteroidota bacterium]NCT16335.1 ATP-binding protein [Flavobacteriales bacterium]